MRGIHTRRYKLMENLDRHTKFMCVYFANCVQNIHYSYQMNRVELLLKLFLKKFAANSAHGFLPWSIDEEKNLGLNNV